MRKVVSVSFPRSGHHLLERCLRGMFPGEVRYCDFYRHCRRSPCVDPQTNLQKCHDFDLRLKRLPGYIYIVQFRHPLEAIVSWYEAELRHRHKDRIGEARIKKVVKLTFLKDTQWYWLFFLAKSLFYWRRFVHKWALRPMDGVLLLPYREFVGQPVETLTQIARLVDNQEGPAEAAIQAVVRDQRIAKRRSIRDFRYFDARRFAWIERRLAGELAALRLESVIPE